MDGKFLRHFGNELFGLVAKCNFGGITESLMKDVFIVSMINEKVQHKLCTELKTTREETIEFSIAYEEGTIRQQSFDKMEKPNIKIGSNDISNINPCKRMGTQ